MFADMGTTYDTHGFHVGTSQLKMLLQLALQIRRVETALVKITPLVGITRDHALITPDERDHAVLRVVITPSCKSWSSAWKGCQA